MRRGAALVGLLALAGCGRDPTPAPPADPHVGTFEIKTENSTERIVLGPGGSAAHEFVFPIEGKTTTARQDGKTRWDDAFLTIEFPEVVNGILMDDSEALNPGPATQRSVYFFLTDDVLNEIEWLRAPEFMKRPDRYASFRSYTSRRFLRVRPGT